MSILRRRSLQRPEQGFGDVEAGVDLGVAPAATRGILGRALDSQSRLMDTLRWQMDKLAARLGCQPKLVSVGLTQLVSSGGDVNGPKGGAAPGSGIWVNWPVGQKPPEAKIVEPDHEHLKKSVDQLIQEQSGFVSTREVPFPSIKSGMDIDNIAAVVAGTKPAGDIGEGIDPRIPEMLAKAREKGLTVRRTRELEVTETREPISHGYVVGDKSSVDELISLRKERLPPEYDQRMGALYGYHPDAIKDHIKQATEKGYYNWRKL